MKKSLLAITLMALLVVGGIGFVAPNGARAASMHEQDPSHINKSPKPQDNWWAYCNGNPSASTCDGQDPVSSGCNNSSVRTVETVFAPRSGNWNSYESAIELRYSPTCNSYWARFRTSIATPCFYAFQSTISRYGGPAYSSPYYNDQCIANSVWSPMLYNTGGIKAIGSLWTQNCCSGNTYSYRSDLSPSTSWH